MAKNETKQNEKKSDNLREGVLAGLRKLLLSNIAREKNLTMKKEWESQLNRFDSGEYFGGEEKDLLLQIADNAVNGEFNEFKKGFAIQAKRNKEGKDIWVVEERNGTYSATGLEQRSVEWELRRCFESRKLRQSKES